MVMFEVNETVVYLKDKVEDRREDEVVVAKVDRRLG
jgi:hypothetical protein